MKKIVLTGGGTAGHVTPNFALIPLLKERDYEITYIGSKDGIEKKLVATVGLPYYGISSGKLRRYFSWKNFTDPFRVVRGYFEARKLLKELRPDVVFSKGGFVTVPVVRAAGALKIPVITHESDMTPGLANKLNLKTAKKICCNFPETAKYLPEGKAVVTGCPIREELFTGSPSAGRVFAGIDATRPALLIIGGSLGSVRVNNAVRSILPELLKSFNIVHICGKGNLDESLIGTPGYSQFEYVSDELKDVFALADVVISRAGANAICELLALRKPTLLIPLSAAASRGDQILNAESFKRQGFANVIREEDITDESLLKAVLETYENKDTLIKAMGESTQANAALTIVDLIDSVL